MLIHKDCDGEMEEFSPTPEMGDSSNLWLRYRCKKCGDKHSRSCIGSLIVEKKIKNNSVA